MLVACLCCFIVGGSVLPGQEEWSYEVLAGPVTAESFELPSQLVAVDPAGESVYVWRKGKLEAWSADLKEEQWSIDHPNRLSILVAREDRLYASEYDTGAIVAFDTKKRRKLWETSVVDAQPGWCRGLDMNPKGDRVAVSWGGVALLKSSGELVAKSKKFGGVVRFTDDGKWLGRSVDRRVMYTKLGRKLDLESWKESRPPKKSVRLGEVVRLSGLKGLLVFGSDGLYQSLPGKKWKRLLKRRDEVWPLPNQVHPTREGLLWATSGSSPRFWSLTGTRKIKIDPHPFSTFYGGRGLLVAHPSGDSIYLSDGTTLRRVKLQPEKPTGWVTFAGVHPRWAKSGLLESASHRFDPSTGAVEPLPELPGEVRAADERFLVVERESGWRLVRRSDGDERDFPAIDEKGLTSSPNGRYIVCSAEVQSPGRSNRHRLYDVEAGQFLREWSGYATVVDDRGVTYSDIREPSSEHFGVVARGLDGSVLWRAPKTSGPLALLPGRTHVVTAQGWIDCTRARVERWSPKKDGYLVSAQLSQCQKYLFLLRRTVRFEHWLDVVDPETREVLAKVKNLPKGFVPASVSADARFIYGEGRTNRYVLRRK